MNTPKSNSAEGAAGQVQALDAQRQKSDQAHLSAPGGEAESLQPRKAEHVLAEGGVFKGHHGLRGLDAAQEFWDQQPYGTRLYYGEGITDYLHRGVLETAIRKLDEYAVLGNRTPARQEERQSLDALHGQIMNLPIPAKARAELEGSPKAFYLLGHRDARHAAAELVAAFASSGPNGNEVGPAPLPVQGQDAAVLLHGDAFLPDVRQALGEVLTEGLLDMAESPDWNDSREVDRVIDMVQNVLARQVEKANEGERDIAALRASSAPTTKG